MLQYCFTAYNYILALPRVISILQHNQYGTKPWLDIDILGEVGAKLKASGLGPLPKLTNMSHA